MSDHNQRIVVLLGALTLISGIVWFATAINAGGDMPEFRPPPKTYKYPLVLSAPLQIKKPLFVIYGHEFLGRTIPAGQTVSRDLVLSVDGPVSLKPPISVADMGDLDLWRLRLGHKDSVTITGSFDLVDGDYVPVPPPIPYVFPPAHVRR